jgi:hypothetical protein
MDQGHWEYFENETLFDPNVPESVQALVDVTVESNQSLAEKKFVIPFLSQVKVARSKGVPVHDALAAHMDCDYRIWQRKFKQVFDPNDAADSCNYIEAEEKS